MSEADVLNWLLNAAPDASQFVILAFIIIRQQFMIEHCEKWRDGDMPPTED